MITGLTNCDWGYPILLGSTIECYIDKSYDSCCLLLIFLTRLCKALMQFSSFGKIGHFAVKHVLNHVIGQLDISFRQFILHLKVFPWGFVCSCLVWNYSDGCWSGMLNGKLHRKDKNWVPLHNSAAGGFLSFHSPERNRNVCRKKNTDANLLQVPFCCQLARTRKTLAAHTCPLNLERCPTVKSSANINVFIWLCSDSTCWASKNALI